jgi:hypothetical protein
VVPLREPPERVVLDPEVLSPLEPEPPLFDALPRLVGPDTTDAGGPEAGGPGGGDGATAFPVTLQ